MMNENHNKFYKSTVSVRRLQLNNISRANCSIKHPPGNITEWRTGESVRQWCLVLLRVRQGGELSCQMRDKLNALTTTQS